jgi:signal transduction histidine kinase
MINRKLSPSMQLALVFLLFGTIWIILTDNFSGTLAHKNFSFLSSLQTYKAVLFMLMSSLFIFLVSKKIFVQQQLLQRDLTEERLRYKNELAQEVFNAQEMERKKLGEELHDNINQLLGVVKLYIEHAQVNPAAKDEMLRKSAEYLMQVINEIRSLSRSLISPTLQDLGLMESINELIESIWEIKQIRIELNNYNFSEETLSDIKKLMVYRIMQEQLNNVVKHSQAENVDIQLKHSGSVVQLTIQDDGIGFDMEKIKPGLGLKNIRHRLELINGNMNVESSPGQGCKLEAMFEV